MLDKLAALLDTGEGEARSRRRESVRKLLEKLERKERKLRAKLEKATDEAERQKITERIRVARAHVKKAREYLEEE